MAPLRALALDPPLQIAQYAHTSWTARDGAVMGPVFAMAQTPDGYLWVGGLFGLYRFDGLRFVQWQPPEGQSLPGNPYSLLVTRDGTLWIGTFEGLASWNGREFTARYPEIGKGFVTTLFEDHAGTVWLGAIDRDGTVWKSVERSRLCSIRAGQVRCTGAEGPFGTLVWSLAEDPAGNLWVSADASVWQWGAVPRQYALPGVRVGDLAVTPDGRILVGSAGMGLMQVAGDRVVPYRFKRATRPAEWLSDRDIKSNKLLHDRDGALWIGSTGVGLVHVKDGRADTFNRVEGLSGNIACSLFEDREGNIWYGSEKGIDRFRKLAVTTLATKQGLPDEVVRSVLSTRDGSVWVATNDGLARWRGGTLVVYRERDGLPGSEVHSLYEDSDGRLWASTTRGLAHFSGGRFVVAGGIPDGEIYSITGDSAGNLWLSSAAGLLRLNRGRLLEQVPWSVFEHPRQAQVVTADRGGVWASFWEDGAVSYFKDGKVQATYKSKEGLGKGHVAGHRLDPDGTVWAATDDGGLARIKDGQVTTLSTANGLPCNRMQWSAPDADGSLWMNTGCGLVRVRRDDLARWMADPRHRVTPTLWDAADGVPILPGGQASFNPAVTRSADGKLWFVAGAELKLVDPAHIPSNPVPPPVHVTALVADDRPYPIGERPHLPALVRDVSVEFAALTLADPKTTRFRYRLEGYDSEWREAVDRRLANYTNLPPGDYRFRVKAANNSGVWNEEGAQLEFSILPAFYQRAWFRVTGAVVLAGLAWTGFQLRLRMRIRRLQRQFEATLEGRVAERTRIARDLHDTLLQHFHGLLLQLQAAFNLLPDRPRESKQVLGMAIDRTAEAITEGRNTVQGLRTSTLAGDDLADALRSLADDLARSDGAAASVHVDVLGTPQALQPLVREQTYRIAGEAVNNALRHAEAKRIDIEIHYDPQQLRLMVRDDGKGLDPQVLRSGEKQGHFGLGGMRERAELIGGQLSVRSGPGTGVEVELVTPASRAYGPPAPDRWRLIRRMFARSSLD